MNIRPMIEGDVAFVISSHNEVQGDDAKLSEKHIYRDILCKNPKAFILVIESDNKPVGFVMYSFCYWASLGQILWISQMFIEPASRGKYFKKILDYLEFISKEDECNYWVWGTQNTADRTLKLWDRIGAKDMSKNYSFWIKKLKGSAS